MVPELLRERKRKQKKEVEGEEKAAEKAQEAQNMSVEDSELPQNFHKLPNNRRKFTPMEDNLLL